MSILSTLDPGGSYLYGPDVSFSDRIDPGGAYISSGGKSGKGGSSQATVQAPAAIEPPAPIIFRMPDFPDMPDMPTVEPYEVPNYAEEELRKVEQARLEAQNRLRVGRAGTIHTSPLGDTEEVQTKDNEILGK